MHFEDPGSPLTEIEEEDLVSESEEDQFEPYPTPEPQPKQRVPAGRQTRAQTAPELTITPYLSSPRTNNYNTSFIYGVVFFQSFSVAHLCQDEMLGKRLNLNPEYQRGLLLMSKHSLTHLNSVHLEVVWSDEKQSMLIDSLFHNIYIPPIIFCKSSPRTHTMPNIITSGSSETHSCMH